MSAAILFVDDDSMVLNALERTFFETEYTTFFATSAADAYGILDKNHIDLVVSDIRMLPVSGPDFLKELSTRYPDILRVVLSAYGDRNIMVKVICEGLAQVYILKPWDNQKLIAQVTRLITMNRTLSEIHSSIGTDIIGHLPPLPSLYARMLAMIEEEKSLKELACLIETDPAATANVLKLANSSFFGITIGSVHQALVYLGITNVKDIVLLSELFGKTTDSAHQDLRIQVNQHMVYTSKLVHGLHQHLLASKLPDEFTVAGLLADIGRLFMIEYTPDSYRLVLDHFISNQDMALTDLEIDRIGYSHTQLGALVLDWWNLPASMVESCMYHHVHPFKTEILPEKLMGLIHIADYYAWKTIEKVPDTSLPEGLLSMFSVSSGQLDSIVASITENQGVR